jgi:hypothetical protein
VTAPKESRFLTELRALADNPATDKKLAKAVGVAPSKVTGYKQGRLRPTMNVWGIIRDKFGTDQTVLLFLAALEDQQEKVGEVASEKLAAALKREEAKRAASR